MRSLSRSRVRAATLLAALALAAPARSAPAAYTTGPSADDGPAVEKWIAARAASARAGKRERVRLPLTVRSLGWGCPCPMHFVGTNVGTHNGGKTWVQPKPGRGVKLQAGRNGVVFMVEGYFTGKTRQEDHRQGGEPAEYLYELWELEVVSARPLTAREQAVGAVLTAEVQAAPAAPAAGTPDRPWIVLAGTYDEKSSKSAGQAESLRARLAKAGFAAAEVLPSKQIPKLRAGFLVVVLSRHATSKEAQAAVDAAKAKGFTTSVRRGW